MDFVDLHVHSNASDGTFSPSQVVELAKMPDWMPLPLQTTTPLPVYLRH